MTAGDRNRLIRALGWGPGRNPLTGTARRVVDFKSMSYSPSLSLFPLCTIAPRQSRSALPIPPNPSPPSPPSTRSTHPLTPHSSQTQPPPAHNRRTPLDPHPRQWNLLHRATSATDARHPGERPVAPLGPGTLLRDAERVCVEERGGWIVEAGRGQGGGG